MLAKPQSTPPIDLAAYGGRRGAPLVRYGFYCVYVMASRSGGPRKIGFARDPAKRLATLQTGHPDRLCIEYLLWTPGSGVAGTIERRVHKALKKSGGHVNGEWYSITPYAAAETIRQGANKLFPSIEFLDHKQMTDLLDTNGLGSKSAANYSDQERNLLVRAMMADPRSPVLPKLGIDVWAELFNPIAQRAVA